MGLPTFPVLGNLQASLETWAEEDKPEGPRNHGSRDRRARKWSLGPEHGVVGSHGLTGSCADGFLWKLL